MTLFTLSFTLLFVFATMMISYWQKLGLEKEIAIGTVRSAIQLLLIGYVLQYVFQTENYVVLTVIILVMIGVASLNAAKRGTGMHGVFWRIAISISVMEVLMMGMLLGLHLIKATPQYIIPLSGMTIGSHGCLRIVYEST